jgi:phosphoribosyl 1,2-cyclic phosphate phosphodiesterase
MKILFLGSGTSTGIPHIGCKCSTCTSTNIKDKRLRASVLIEINNNNILIDCGPDFRQQILKYQIDRIDSILFTHEHYDHIGGLDDVRPLGNMNIYARRSVLEAIERNMYYCFAENKYPGIPVLQLNEVFDSEFIVNTIKILPIEAMHYKLPILGFRIGNFAYLTDVKTLDKKAIKQLEKLDILVINALRKLDHIAHLTLDEALSLAKKIGAKKTYFTHISHDLGLHDEVSKELNENIYLAYDGLILEL